MAAAGAADGAGVVVADGAEDSVSAFAAAAGRAARSDFGAARDAVASPFAVSATAGGAWVVCAAAGGVAAAALAALSLLSALGCAACLATVVSPLAAAGTAAGAVAGAAAGVALPDPSSRAAVVMAGLASTAAGFAVVAAAVAGVDAAAGCPAAGGGVLATDAGRWLIHCPSAWSAHTVSPTSRRIGL